MGTRNTGTRRAQPAPARSALGAAITACRALGLDTLSSEEVGEGVGSGGVHVLAMGGMRGAGGRGMHETRAGGKGETWRMREEESQEKDSDEEARAEVAEEVGEGGGARKGAASSPITFSTSNTSHCKHR